MKISGESMMLTAICLADLASTIFLVNYRHASEGNPLMAYYLNHSLIAFIGVKLILFVMPILIIEYVRRQRPRLGRLGLRVAIAAYLLAYLGGVAHLNQPAGLTAGRYGSPQMASMAPVPDSSSITTTSEDVPQDDDSD